jgi:hypothetical protein
MSSIRTRLIKVITESELPKGMEEEEEEAAAADR